MMNLEDSIQLPDTIYTHFAPIYHQMINRMPNWTAWISSVLPHIQGPKVLDISFGTGYLLSKITSPFEAFGIELNMAMIAHTRKNLSSPTQLQRADAHHLPYRGGCFNTVLNTMAFNGYPDSCRALTEMHRVLRRGGQLLIVDVNPPADGNPIGRAFARRWETRLDQNLDMGSLFEQVGFTFVDHDIGGFGSVHLYIATKC